MNASCQLLPLGKAFHCPFITSKDQRKKFQKCIFYITKMLESAFYNAIATVLFHCPGLTLAAHLSTILVTAILHMSGYDILPAKFSRVPLNLEEDNSKLRADAWKFVAQDPQINLNAASLGVQGERVVRYDMLQLVYELKNSNVFTKQNLELIQKTEDELFSNTVYQQKLCLLMQNGLCKPPTSILRFFDGTFKKVNPFLNDPKFENIPRVLSTAKVINVTRAILDYHLSKDAVITPTTAVSAYTRTFLSLGFPFAGFQSTTDQPDEQFEFAQKHSGEAFAEALDKLYQSGIDDMSFYYNLRSLFFDAISKQVIWDLLLVFGSFAFIFCFMLFQTQSLWITGWGVFSVFSCFFGANIIYRVLLDFRYIGIFHVLSVFIILGIGADDIFVFCDTWRASQDKNFPDLVTRFSVVFSHAASAMFTTSFTTMVAFISNVFSPLLGVCSFGTFSALLVFVNYLSVIIFFPTVVITYELYWKNWQWPCFKLFNLCTTSPPRDNHISPMPIEQHEVKDSLQEAPVQRGNSAHQLVARFFGGFYFDKVVGHKVVRWLILVVIAAFITLSVTYATQIAADQEEVI